MVAMVDPCLNLGIDCHGERRKTTCCRRVIESWTMIKYQKQQLVRTPVWSIFDIFDTWGRGVLRVLICYESEREGLDYVYVTSVLPFTWNGPVLYRLDRRWHVSETRRTNMRMTCETNNTNSLFLVHCCVVNIGWNEVWFQQHLSPLHDICFCKSPDSSPTNIQYQRRMKS
jgi:hypothetical protein